MKIAILCDTHSGARNSSDIFLNYHARFYSEVFFPYCDKHSIKQILHLGDYYDHRKFINFKALNHNRRVFLEPMRARGMTMDIIPGNHDVVFKNTNDLCSLKELLGFFIKDVNIIMKPKVMSYDGCNIALLPWINTENYAESIKFVETCGASILGAHLELQGFDLMKGMPASNGMSPDLFSRFEMVWTGHYHTKQQKGNINYFGCQYEMIWADADDPKYFHVFDTVTHEITAVRNPLTIHSKIFYDDNKTKYDELDLSKYKNNFIKVIVTNKSDIGQFDRFIDNLQKQEVYEIKIAETYDEFLGVNVANEDIETVSDTSVLLDSYVEAVDTELNKDIIKTKLRELYVEAQNETIC